MVKKIVVEAFKATWSEINEAIEAASREELLEVLREHHQRRAKTLKA